MEGGVRWWWWWGKGGGYVGSWGCFCLSVFSKYILSTEVIVVETRFCFVQGHGVSNDLKQPKKK